MFQSVKELMHLEDALLQSPAYPPNESFTHSQTHSSPVIYILLIHSQGDVEVNRPHTVCEKSRLVLPCSVPYRGKGGNYEKSTNNNYADS